MRAKFVVRGCGLLSRPAPAPPKWCTFQCMDANALLAEARIPLAEFVYAVVSPHRVRPVLDLLQHHLSRHAHVHLNHGKTRVWNAAGQAPPNISDLGPEVWVGNHSSPPNVQGLRVLGVPIGHPAYIQTQLQQISAQHSEFLDKIPALEDVQASWLLLLFCASPRANYLLRNLPPPTTATFVPSPSCSKPARSPQQHLPARTCLFTKAVWV